jgi:hypothetical protein
MMLILIRLITYATGYRFVSRQYITHLLEGNRHLGIITYNTSAMHKEQYTHSVQQHDSDSENVRSVVTENTTKILRHNSLNDKLVSTRPACVSEDNT